MKTYHLLEVGAKGNMKVDMENGKCIFSGLKFNTTSYNHDVIFNLSLASTISYSYHSLFMLE